MGCGCFFGLPSPVAASKTATQKANPSRDPSSGAAVAAQQKAFKSQEASEKKKAAASKNDPKFKVPAAPKQDPRAMTFDEIQKTRRKKPKTRGKSPKAQQIALGLLMEVLQTGETKTQICVGKSELCDKNDFTRSIPGLVTIVGNPKAMRGTLTVSANRVTLGAMAYLAMGEQARSLLGPVAGMGLKRAAVSVEVAKGTLILRGRGSITLGFTGACKGVILCFLEKAVSSLVLAPMLQIVSGSIKLEFAIKLPKLMLSKNSIYIEDVRGDGPSIFVAVERTGGVVESSAGARLPLKICVENCKAKNRRFLFFEGELAVSLSPTAQVVTGKLSMMGMWLNSFGLKFLHISHLSLLVGVDVKVMLPTKLEIGAIVCLGARDTCAGKSKSSNFIRGAAFIGLDATDPEGNYGMFMMSEISIGKIFSVFGDTISKKFHTWRKALPPPLAQSGIYPLTKCTAKETANPTRQECFAMISFSPVAAQVFQTTYGAVTIQQGFNMAGRLNLLGWNLSVKVSIQYGYARPSFYISAKADPLAFPNNKFPIIQLGRTRDDMKQGPRFLVDFGHSSPLAAQVYIAGAFKIKPLMTSGEVKITLDSTGYKFSTSAMILGLAKSSYKVEWLFKGLQYKVNGKWELMDSSGVAIKLVSGVLKMVRAMYNKALDAINQVVKWIPAAKEKLLSVIRDIRKSVCVGTFKHLCKKAFDAGLSAAKKAGDFGTKHLDRVIGKLRKIPDKAVASKGISAAKMMGNAADKVVSVMKKLLNVYSFEFGMELDNGNVKAHCKLSFSALGQKHNLSFYAEMNMKEIAKRIYDKGMQFFEDFPKFIKDKATKMFDSANKEANKAIDKLINTLKNAGKKAIEKAAKFAKAAVEKTKKLAEQGVKKGERTAKAAERTTKAAAERTKKFAERKAKGAERGAKAAAERGKKVAAKAEVAAKKVANKVNPFHGRRRRRWRI